MIWLPFKQTDSYLSNNLSSPLIYQNAAHGVRHFRN